MTSGPACGPPPDPWRPSPQRLSNVYLTQLAELKLKQLKKDEEKKKGDGNSMAGKFEVLLGGGKGKGAGEGSKKVSERLSFLRRLPAAAARCGRGDTY